MAEKKEKCETTLNADKRAITDSSSSSPSLADMLAVLNLNRKMNSNQTSPSSASTGSSTSSTSFCTARALIEPIEAQHVETRLQQARRDMVARLETELRKAETSEGEAQKASKLLIRQYQIALAQLTVTPETVAASFREKNKSNADTVAASKVKSKSKRKKKK